MSYPKRLIEVDLPIKRISAHARREKSIRHGHISTLHIWWARRPLAACRAVLCAALWPDPADPFCPSAFRTTAANLVTAFAKKATTTKLNESCSQITMERWLSLSRTGALLDTDNPTHVNLLRHSLLDFIADFANWDNANHPDYLTLAQALTQAAHEALGGAPGTRPMVADPFAGGGAIPLEALRVGADAFASDLNPVAVLLNKVVLEYIPKYGNTKFQITNSKGDIVVLNGLAEMVRYWGNWIKEEAKKELSEFYPEGADGSTTVAYLWARTIRCEGPGCGAEVPLMRSFWLAKKGERSVAVRLVPDIKNKHIDFEIIQKHGGKWVSQSSPKSEIKNLKFDGTVKRGSATCPVCGYTTPVAHVRAQFKERHGGANDARLFCVVTTSHSEQGRSYRLPTPRDLDAVCKAVTELERRKKSYAGPLSLVPDEKISLNEIRRISVPLYGMTTWGDLFSARQALTLIMLIEVSGKIRDHLGGNSGLATAVQTLMALAIDRQADYGSSMCRWVPSGEFLGNTFGRQAIGMIWDFAEVNSFSDSTGSYQGALEWIYKVCVANQNISSNSGHVENASATEHPLPADFVQCLFTDPPYYDAVPYSHLSDFFYVWLRRSLVNVQPDLFIGSVVSKNEEIVVDRPHELSTSTHDIDHYERELAKAFAEGRRILAPDGIGTIVFASKTTSSWEAILQAVVDAGWIITGSWPIDTEMESRVSAQGQARLASSVHLVCRPREKPDGVLLDNAVGDWRDVLFELPERIGEWMSRLTQEGVVGADAIFACLGPALEIFTRYNRVEKADGQIINLRTYLEQVWGAVAREALATIFKDADSTGFEEDARLTVIWFWSLQAVFSEDPNKESETIEEADDADEDLPGNKQSTGYALEYDTARKLAQGLGVDLHKLSRSGGIVTVKGKIATLNKVIEREDFLLGEQLTLLDDDTYHKNSHRLFARQEAWVTLKPVESRQGKLLDEHLLPVVSDSSQPYLPALRPDQNPQPLLERVMTSGITILDRLHQSMLLFGRSQSALLGLFFQETRMGADPRFWRLAQALSALYPSGSQEKRWVDGVLARKKGLGL